MLRASIDDIANECQRIVEIFEQRKLLIVEEGIVRAGTYGSDEFASLHELAELIEPTLERFHIVIALLNKDETRSIRDLEADASAVAQQLSAIYGINSPDFFERSLFSNFINCLKSEGLISISDGMVKRSDRFDDLTSATARTLDADVQHNVLQAIPS